MATYQLMCWKEIPSVVEAKAEGAVHKEQLSKRFQELIDLVAMRQGLAGSDAYLEQWNKSARQERAGSAIDVARAVAAEIEARFDQVRISRQDIAFVVANRLLNPVCGFQARRRASCRGGLPAFSLSVTSVCVSVRFPGKARDFACMIANRL
ncbi:MAG: virulence factor [Acidobacteriota bacterium]